MKIKMLVDAKGSANISGNAIKQYTIEMKSLHVMKHGK